MTLRRVSTGDSIIRPAKEYNTIIDATNYITRRDGGFGISNGIEDTFQHLNLPVIVKNSTGGDLNPFNIVGIDAPRVLPGDNLDRFKFSLTFNSVTPTATHRHNFAVLLEAVKDGKMAEAALIGVVPTQIDVTDEDHDYAVAKASDSTQLSSATGGTAQILWKESGTGTKWAVVRLGGAGGRKDKPAVVNTSVITTYVDGTNTLGSGKFKWRKRNGTMTADDGTGVHDVWNYWTLSQSLPIGHRIWVTEDEYGDYWLTGANCPLP